MTRILTALLCGLTFGAAAGAAEVLLVADELPAMQYLADQLAATEHIPGTVVTQDKMPPDLTRFSAVLVYIHGKLAEVAETAFIDYTRKGGKLIVLHHSISSGKRRNKQWFPFLGVKLPTGDANAGGYQWIEPVTLEIVNLAPRHFITTHQVEYPLETRYTPDDAGAGGGESTRPGFRLPESEVYLNHTYTEPRTLLLGFKYTDARTGQTYMQDRAGWIKPAGQGWIIYFLPGHSLRDFQNPTYRRLVLNAVLYPPGDGK